MAGHGHIIPASTYWKTFVILMILMVLTVWVAGFDLGWLNIPIAATIAVTKATLVVLFFMGVKYGTRLTWLWAALGFVWLIIMAGIGVDYAARQWFTTHGWE